MAIRWIEPRQRRRILARSGFPVGPASAMGALSAASAVGIAGVAVAGYFLFGWLSPGRMQDVFLIGAALALVGVALGRTVPGLTTRAIQVGPEGVTVWYSDLTPAGLFGAARLRLPAATIRTASIAECDSASGPFPVLVVESSARDPVVVALPRHLERSELEVRLGEWGLRSSMPAAV